MRLHRERPRPAAPAHEAMRVELRAVGHPELRSYVVARLAAEIKELAGSAGEG